MRRFQRIKKLKIVLSAITLLMLSVSCGTPDQTPGSITEINTPNFQIDEGMLGKFSLVESVKYKNLQIFMINGKVTASNIPYVPLKLAMEKKWVEVKETSNVNELEITNLSDNVIFINAGDIVRGGKQDRMLTYDMIIGPHAKNEKLSSFCVESGRWSKRGGESADQFGSNEKMITSRKLKISSKRDKNQQKVWKSVEAQTKKLNYNVSKYANKEVDVKANVSGSSLELALDNKELKQMKEDYKKHFINMINNETAGFAYAINGELYTVDIYNNKELFKQYFEKLLDAAIVEAITDLDEKQTKNKQIDLAEVNALLSKTTHPNEDIKDLSERTRWASKEEKGKIIFTSIDRKNNLIWVHKNIIIKDPNEDYTKEEVGINQQIFNSNSFQQNVNIGQQQR